MDGEVSELAGFIDGTFEGLLGVVYDHWDHGEISGHVEITDDLLTVQGTVPLGVYATLAEGAASIATALGVRDRGMDALGMTNDTTVLRGLGSKHLRFIAHCQGMTDDLAVWSIEFRDANEAATALSRVQVAIRPSRTKR